MLLTKHGGDIKPANGAKKLPLKTRETPAESKFDYLLPDLKTQSSARLPDSPAVVAALKALGAAMIDQDPTTEPSVIPAIYTYWGQFIDHDMTANTDRDGTLSDIKADPLSPHDPVKVANGLPNLRRPTFDLDSLYGNGPGLDPSFYCPDPGPPDRWLYKGAKFRIGRNAASPGDPIPPVNDLKRDLPRVGDLIASGQLLPDDFPDALRNAPNRATVAAIADARNDENLIVAQFHLAFLRFHNKVVDAVTAYPLAFGLRARPSVAEVFGAAHRLTRYHYQWLVVHDYLKTVTLPGIVDKVLIGGNRFYPDLPKHELFAPLEYSVAAFRFGHSMVRGGYDHNRNFGAGPNAFLPFARFEQLFEFTGNGHRIDPVDITKSVPSPLGGTDKTLPSNWIIEWDRLSSKVDADARHFARKIDTQLVPPVLNMVNQGVGEPSLAIRQLLRDLSTRNLLRGYLLSIPTGQAIAAEMGVDPLTEEELKRDNAPAVDAALALDNDRLLKQTPLWYYVLKEAEVRADGDSLGELGSRIVVETQIGLLRNDPESYLYGDTPWDPSQGVKLPNGDPIVTIRDLLHFVGLPA